MPCCHGQNPQFFVVPFSEIVIYPIGPDTLQPLGGLHSHSGMTISMIWHQALPIFTGLPFMQIIRGELADEASVGFFCFLLGTWVPGLWHECGVYMVFWPPKPVILLFPEAFWLGVRTLSCKIVIEEWLLWKWCRHCVLLSKGWLFTWGVTSHVCGVSMRGCDFTRQGVT